MLLEKNASLFIIHNCISRLKTLYMFSCLIRFIPVLFSPCIQQDLNHLHMPSVRSHVQRRGTTQVASIHRGLRPEQRCGHLARIDAGSLMQRDGITKIHIPWLWNGKLTQLFGYLLGIFWTNCDFGWCVQCYVYLVDWWMVQVWVLKITSRIKHAIKFKPWAWMKIRILRDQGFQATSLPMNFSPNTPISDEASHQLRQSATTAKSPGFSVAPPAESVARLEAKRWGPHQNDVVTPCGCLSSATVRYAKYLVPVLWL